MDDQHTLLENAQMSMQKIHEKVEKKLIMYRPNSIHGDMVSQIKVDYHGVLVPLEQVASISTKGASTIIIKPWEQKLLPVIERAITKENKYKLSIQNKGDTIEAKREPLTEEARKEQVKQVKVIIEESKVALLKIRQKAREKIKEIKAKDEAKRQENELQKITDKSVALLNGIQKQKQEELMKV